MVLTSDTYSRPGCQQECYSVVQENYGYPQAGYSYSTPVGPGYNSGPFSHSQHQPMVDFYNRPHDYSSDHDQSHGHKYEHQNQHGHSYDHNQNHGHKYQHQNQHGHSYDNNQNHGHKYQHQNQHGMTTYSAAELGFGANPCPPMGHGYGTSHVSGPGKFGKIYSAFKEADD